MPKKLSDMFTKTFGNPEAFGKEEDEQESPSTSDYVREYFKPVIEEKMKPASEKEQESPSSEDQSMLDKVRNYINARREQHQQLLQDQSSLTDDYMKMLKNPDMQGPRQAGLFDTANPRNLAYMKETLAGMPAMGTVKNVAGEAPALLSQAEKQFLNKAESEVPKLHPLDVLKGRVGEVPGSKAEYLTSAGKVTANSPQSVPYTQDFLEGIEQHMQGIMADPKVSQAQKQLMFQRYLKYKDRFGKRNPVQE